MAETLSGIHHITAIARDPQRNLDFYTKVLGLRLVKQTVNFDDPGTYHFYFGDDKGTPGTILTFFPYSGARSAQRGTGQITSLAFAIPRDAVNYWHDRLTAHGVHINDPLERFGEMVLTGADPDGTVIEFVATNTGTNNLTEPWGNSPVPSEVALRGFHNAELWVQDRVATDELLTVVMGFERIAVDGQRTRYRTGTKHDANPANLANLIDVVQKPHTPRGHGGAGSIHHIAWRTPDDDTQIRWRSTIQQAGLDITPVRDRQYFRSIYFFEPSGALFEIATDTPGFAIDEPHNALGQQLKLPQQLESQRSLIEQHLPAITLPAAP